LEGYRFTVVEMDRRRVARVKIQRLKQAADSPVSASPSVPSPATVAKPVAENARKRE
jgi:hypothetical protein